LNSKKKKRHTLDDESSGTVYYLPPFSLEILLE
jgi:hypothetical protein